MTTTARNQDCAQSTIAHNQECAQPGLGIITTFCATTHCRHAAVSTLLRLAKTLVVRNLDRAESCSCVE